MASRRPAPAPALRSGDLTMIVAGAAVFLLALGALLTGDSAGGLDAAAARRVPGGFAVWAVVGVVEFAVLALVVALARVVSQTHRPRGDRATRAEAAAAAAPPIGARLRPVEASVLAERDEAREHGLHAESTP
jgi:hypothetical protein